MTFWLQVTEWAWWQLAWQAWV